jgi:DNA replication licensing factor MCM2
MIRMAEASARMSLREYVRADDIDLAISVVVESFVNVQKMSIKKTLQRVRLPFLISSPTTYPLFLIGVGHGLIYVLNSAPESITCRREITMNYSLSCLFRSWKRKHASSSSRIQLQRHRQPELVTVNTSELDEQVCDHVVLNMSHASLNFNFNFNFNHELVRCINSSRRFLLPTYIHPRQTLLTTMHPTIEHACWW